MATLLSVNVGQPKDVAWEGNTVFTGIWKRSVAGPRMVRTLNIDGDGQGDLNGHGGEHRAVMVYQVDSYEYWQSFLGRSDFEYGEFGENFTVDGMADDTVCVGDRYQIGGATFEVTQPRVTCYRVGMRVGEPRMPSLLVAHHRPGFYFRVLAEGAVSPGDPITKIGSGEGAVTVAEASALLYLPDRDTARLAVAASIPALSQGWRQSYRDLLSPPAASGSGQSGAWSGFRPLRVTRTQAETDVVLSIYLAVEGNEPLPGPAPGQYLTVRVPVPGVPAAVRSYSISGAPGGGYRISVKRETPGSVSSYLHSTITAGSTLDVAAPRGEFVLRDDDSPVLLLSAGIGATPVLAMLAHLAEARSRRDVWWIHTARDRAHHVFAEESRALIAALPNGHLHTFLTGEPTGAQADDTVTAGRPDAAALTALGISPMSSAYLCGPTGFLADVQAALTAAGVAPQSIYSELFGARSPVNPGLVDVARPAPHHPPGAPGDGPLVTFARSGLSVAWPARQHSLLDLADSCDVPTRWSCRTGVCHTCSTGLLSGQTTYVTEPLEPPPDGEVLICCAAPSSDVVIDL